MSGALSEAITRDDARAEEKGPLLPEGRAVRARNVSCLVRTRLHVRCTLSGDLAGRYSTCDQPELQSL